MSGSPAHLPTVIQTEAQPVTAQRYSSPYRSVCNNRNRTRFCIVSDCKNTKSLFLFPTDASLKSKWLEWLSSVEKNLIINRESAVCLRHFKREDFKNLLQYRLTKDDSVKLKLATKAIPCIADPSNEIHQPPLSEDEKRAILQDALAKSAAENHHIPVQENVGANCSSSTDTAHANASKTRSCIVSNCDSTKYLFTLPSDVLMRNAWLKWLSNIQKEVKTTPYSTICFRHFKREDIANLAQFRVMKDSNLKLRLEPKAVPSVVSAADITSPSQLLNSPLTKRAKRAIIRDALAEPVPWKYRTITAPPPKRKKKTSDISKPSEKSMISLTETTTSKGKQAAGKQQERKKKYKTTTSQTDSKITGLPPPLAKSPPSSASISTVNSTPSTESAPSVEASPTVLVPFNITIPANLPQSTTLKIVPTSKGIVVYSVVTEDKVSLETQAPTKTINTATISSKSNGPLISSIQLGNIEVSQASSMPEYEAITLSKECKTTQVTLNAPGLSSSLRTSDRRSNAAAFSSSRVSVLEKSTQ